MTTNSKSLDILLADIADVFNQGDLHCATHAICLNIKRIVAEYAEAWDAPPLPPLEHYTNDQLFNVFMQHVKV